jgi:hypothetical protein
MRPFVICVNKEFAWATPYYICSVNTLTGSRALFGRVMAFFSARFDVTNSYACRMQFAGLSLPHLCGNITEDAPLPAPLPALLRLFVYQAQR